MGRMDKEKTEDSFKACHMELGTNSLCSWITYTPCSLEGETVFVGVPESLLNRYSPLGAAGKCYQGARRDFWAESLWHKVMK